MSDSTTKTNITAGNIPNDTGNQSSATTFTIAAGMIPTDNSQPNLYFVLGIPF